MAGKNTPARIAATGKGCSPQLFVAVGSARISTLIQWLKDRFAMARNWQ
jgi:hypothetical protein